MKQIIVHCGDEIMKAALREEGRLVEYYVERAFDKQLVGNIYKGKVVNVLPGMQAAFVNIGLDKNAFLYVDDVLPAHLEKIPPVKPSIAELLREGQELLVQIAKEPIGTKGARVTTHISIPGRWIVYMPEADYVGVSRKIEPEEERERLKTIGEKLRWPGEGLILRTVAQEESQAALEHDLNHLRNRWAGIQRAAEKTTGVGELFQERELMERIVRDLFTAEVERLEIDSADKAAALKLHLADISPELVSRVHVYEGREPIMKHYGIDEQLSRVYRNKIWLASGGYINVDRTEALTVIDVNTGKFTGTDNLEQTVFVTNLEAAEEIATILRLRDIGGIVIVDFIDMKEDGHRAIIEERLSELLKKDRTKTLIVGWTKLGLLEITRKKVKENLDDLFYEKCTRCGGQGRIFTKLHPAFDH